jgi:hypothetical protein
VAELLQFGSVYDERREERSKRIAVRCGKLSSIEKGQNKALSRDYRAGDDGYSREVDL